MKQPIDSMPKVIEEGARVLILGAMPGRASLAKQPYDAHPRNQSWPIVYILFGSRQRPCFISVNASDSIALEKLKDWPKVKNELSSHRS
ncbi:hypothetical protein [Sporolactobacillus terrae]|uniref:hypothetical protein n=1 Tax=Sporolactobacillus terrae TaxID=269673 RepID=UPI000490D6D3|nr:hypothetical protein [Sporolactobacillus terrae]